MVSVSVRHLFYQPIGEKIKTWTLRFPAKETLIWRCIVRLANRVAVWRQSEVSVDFQKVLGRPRAWSFFTRAFAQPTKSHARCIHSINQSISVRLMFLFCARVFISRSYENRSNVNLWPGLWRNSVKRPTSIKRPLTGTPSGRFMEVQRQGER